MWKIGNVEIKNRIVFAPMAGISNESYRHIIKSMDAGLIYSEMISDKGIVYNFNIETNEGIEVLANAYNLLNMIADFNQSQIIILYFSNIFILFIDIKFIIFSYFVYFFNQI